MKEHQRVLIVDDHPIVLRGLRALLEGESWVDEVLEATTAADAVKVAVTGRAHMVVMDVQFPDGDGIDATVRILRAVPSVVVLIMTMDGDQDIVARAMEAGARGFVLKDLDPDDMMSSLRTMAGGSVVIGPNVEYSMINEARRRSAHLPPPLDQLTPREVETLTLLAASETTVRIARRLGVTEKTVRNQLSAIFTKLGVRDRVQAALLAQRLGLKP